MTDSQMRTKSNLYRIVLAIIIMLQFIAALYFSTRKTGFHYDEYYSYYSSNVSYGLIPTDNSWMDTGEIKDEFMVLKGQGFNYSTVKLMQTYDVHPPFYYYILHTVCSLTPGVFSKWQGLAVNLLFYVLCSIMMMLICQELGMSRTAVAATILLYGFSPAILSGVMFIRMYVLLTFLCMLTLYVHLRVMREQKNYWPVLFVLSFLGSQTHYYFIVFLFFTAAYMSIYIWVRSGGFKRALLYASSIILGLVASVAYYPSMLSHIFRGYRGTEATSAFFDMGNLKDRAGLFIGMLDEYLLPGMFYLLVLYALVMYITYRYAGKRSGDRSDQLPFIATVTAGYFLVVLKTALMNAEEAVRYEMPVYGLIILLIVYTLMKLIFFGADSESSSEEEHIEYPSKGYGSYRFKTILFCALLSIALLLQIKGLFTGKVLFLYEDDATSYDWAKEHKDDTIVYIYNPDNQWMIWDDSCELMNYDKIFFISAGNSDEITDETVKNADHLYVYAVRSDEAKERLESINDLKNRESEPFVLRQLQYADLYELK